MINIKIVRLRRVLRPHSKLTFSTIVKISGDT